MAFLLDPLSIQEIPYIHAFELQSQIKSSGASLAPQGRAASAVTNTGQTYII